MLQVDQLPEALACSLRQCTSGVVCVIEGLRWAGRWLIQELSPVTVLIPFISSFIGLPLATQENIRRLAILVVNGAATEWLCSAGAGAGAGMRRSSRHGRDGRRVCGGGADAEHGFCGRVGRQPLRER